MFGGKIQLDLTKHWIGGDDEKTISPETHLYFPSSEIVEIKNGERRYKVKCLKHAQLVFEIVEEIKNQ